MGATVGVIVGADDGNKVGIVGIFDGAGVDFVMAL